MRSKIQGQAAVTPIVVRRIRQAIAQMHEAYGPQGWWPVRCERRQFVDPNGERGTRGYHPGQFNFPSTRRGRWEIICGAVLTQNTAWTNVERALDGLCSTKLVTAEAIRECASDVLAGAIRPAGYFNQKSRYLVAIAEWFIERDVALKKSEPSRPLLEALRPELLKVLGVGRETADSILLYAYGLPTFVVDTYTRRVFGRIGVVDDALNYEQIRWLFERALVKPTVQETVVAWQEAHALIVEHAKRFHGRGADIDSDFLVESRAMR